MKQVSILLFNIFETLDVFGPVEIFGRLKEYYKIEFYSLDGGIITNEHNVRIETLPLDKIINGTDILLIPGGYGTRKEVFNTRLLQILEQICTNSTYVLTVCTGTALLAKTNLLNGKVATTNKKAFQWVTSLNDTILWNQKARWTKDGKFYTSAGVSAGMDLALALLAELHDIEFARMLAFEIEYRWNEDNEEDEFYKAYL